MSDFTIHEDGRWDGLMSIEHHYFDHGLAEDLYKFFLDSHTTSLVDLGAGLGEYARYFNNHDLKTDCYDGNPNTEALSRGLCKVANLAEDISYVGKYDWVMSLEVGEHLPQQYEDIFLQNLDKLNSKGIVLSWAIEGQGGDGHVNLRNNDYIKAKFDQMGYVNDVEAENMLREHRDNWFKNTIMVFKRPDNASRDNDL